MKFKKIAGIVFTLCLIVAMVPLAVFADDDSEREGGRWGKDLYILGRKVASTSDINEVPHEGTITYESGSRTLTLENAVLDLDDYSMPGVTNNYAAAISASDELTIVLKGTNRICSKANAYGDDKTYVYGIKNSGGDTTIEGTGEGTGKLEISLESVSGKSFTGIDCKRMFYVNGCDLDVNITGSESSTGIDIFRDFGIDKKGSVNANVTVTVAGNGSTAVDGTAMFSGSYVSAGSVMKMTAQNGTAFYCYMPSENLSSATVRTCTGGTWSDDIAWNSGGDTYLPDYQYVAYNGSDSGVDRAAKLYLLGRKIESTANISSVPHQGTITYKDGVLTLTDAVLDLKDYKAPAAGGNLIAAIYGTSDLAIVLEGESKIIFTGEKYDKDTEYAYGIESWGNLSFTGSGTLNIALADDAAGGSNENTRIYGIGCDEDVNVEKAAVNIDMGDKGKATGMYLWGPVNLSGGATVRVTAKGANNYAVNGVNDIAKSTVSTDSLFEMTADNIAFNCWSAGAGLKEAGALVNTNATPDGAVVWDRSTWLNEYKYVRFPEYDPDVITIKDDNTLSVKGKKATVRYADLKKKNRNLAVSKVISFKNKGQGTKTYAKVSGSKKILVSKKTGKVTVKKGIKKGTYKVKVKVRAAGNKTHNAAVKTVTFRIIVK